MAFADYIRKSVDKTRAIFSKDQDKLVDYLIKYELKNYFTDDLSVEEKNRLRSDLEKKISDNIDKYDGEMNGLARKVGAKGTMGLAIANELYSYLSKVPLANLSGANLFLFGAKTLMEVPALYRYLKKSKDWYGALTYALVKPINYLLPIVGPALESGSFERMVLSNVLKETKYDFIKENGDLISRNEEVKKRLKTSLRDLDEAQEELPMAA